MAPRRPNDVDGGVQTAGLTVTRPNSRTQRIVDAVRASPLADPLHRSTDGGDFPVIAGTDDRVLLDSESLGRGGPAWLGQVKL